MSTHLIFMTDEWLLSGWQVNLVTPSKVSWTLHEVIKCSGVEPFVIISFLIYYLEGWLWFHLEMVCPSFPCLRLAETISAIETFSLFAQNFTRTDVVSTDVVIRSKFSPVTHIDTHFARRRVDVVCCTSISSLQPLVVSDMNIWLRGIRIKESLDNDGVAECSAFCWKIKINSNQVSEDDKQWPLMKW